MTAVPQTSIPENHRDDLIARHERFIDSEARLLVSRGVHPGTRKGQTLARLEVALTLGAHDVVEHAVAIARSERVSWDAIARVTGLASRGSAARRFGAVRVSENETSGTAPRASIHKLNRARSSRNDDFRTRLEDVERELSHYPDQFRDRVVFLNCDDPESAFWQYFDQNFDRLGLRRLIATHYAPEGGAFALEVVRGAVGAREARMTPLRGDGDFRSAESVALLEQADIVVTNPPFSLFRDFLAQLVDHEKRFLVLAGMNAVTNKQVWSLIETSRLWLGATANSGEMQFLVPDDYSHSVNLRIDDDGQRWIGVGVRWLTNIDVDRRHTEIPLTRRFSDDPSAYPTYDNFNAIEVSKVADIPADYSGDMGVPITFLGRHDPDQFEIVGASMNVPEAKFSINGRWLYDRIVIRRVAS